MLHLSRKIILANLKIWCSKMQPLSGYQRADLLTSLMNMSLVLRLPREMHLCRSSSKVTCMPAWLKLLQNLNFCSLLAGCRIPCACHTKRRFNVQRWCEHVFLACSLRNVLPARVACTFPTSQSQLPKVLQHWCVLYILTSKGALRHNGGHFFNSSTSKSAPNPLSF